MEFRFPSSPRSRIEVKMRPRHHFLSHQPRFREIGLVSQQAPTADKHYQNTDPTWISNSSDNVDITQIPHDILLFLDFSQMGNLITVLRRPFKKFRLADACSILFA